MKKPVKLLLYLLLSTAILFFLWARAECPRLTAQGALNRVESSNLAPKSRLISTDFLGTVNSNGTNYRRYIAAGVTDTHLHMTEVWKGSFFWRHTGRLYMPLTSIPLESAIAGLAPDQWPFDFSFFCYTTLPAQRWEARLTVGSFVCTQEGQCDPGGFTLFSFDKPACRRAGYWFGTWDNHLSKKVCGFIINQRIPVSRKRTVNFLSAAWGLFSPAFSCCRRDTGW